MDDFKLALNVELAPNYLSETSFLQRTCGFDITVQPSPNASLHTPTILPFLNYAFLSSPFLALSREQSSLSAHDLHAIDPPSFMTSANMQLEDSFSARGSALPDISVIVSTSGKSSTSQATKFSSSLSPLITILLDPSQRTTV